MKGLKVPSLWQKIATRMYLPVNSEGVLLIAEGSPNPAMGDISYLLPFDLDLDPEVSRRTWNAFNRRKQAVVGVGFAQTAAAALAAVMGDRKAAADLFRSSWRPYWLEPYGMIRETVSQSYGCFLTDYCSILQSAMLTSFYDVLLSRSAVSSGKYPVRGNVLKHAEMNHFRSFLSP
jgi:hypothetical protein